MSQSATEALAGYVGDTRHPPAEVTEQAKLHIADTLACIYAGTETDAVKILAESNYWTGTPDDIPVPGWGYAKTLDGAAQLLGTAAHAHDFDDKSYLMPGHPSAPIVAALLATIFDFSTNHAKALSGRSFIHAYIKGIEVSGKFGEIIADDHTDQGWHNISTVGLLGAAAACAALRGLDASKNERALAIAASHASGILNNSGTMVKPLHCGNAARAAYMAAALAQREFTAGDDFLAGNYGFIHAFTGGRRTGIELPPVDLQGLYLPPLTGRHFELINPGLDVKQYPCCHVAHTGINGMRKIRERKDFHIGEVEKIICYVPTRKRMSYLQCPDPKTPTEARFSMNFAVAAAMRYGTVELEHFNTELLASGEFRQLMALVEMRLQDKNENNAVDIEVFFKNGRCMSERGAQTPVTWDYIASKFSSCMKHAPQPCDPERVLGMLKHLEIQEDVSGIFKQSGISHTPASRA